MAMSDPPRHLISQVEYARLRGWSKQYVGQLVAKGRIPLVGGMVDPTTADAALAQHYDPGRSARFRGDRQARDDDGGAPDPDGALKGPLAKARTVREHFRAMREKLEYEQLAGSLVSRSQIEGACCARGARFDGCGGSAGGAGPAATLSGGECGGGGGDHLAADERGAGGSR